MATEQLPDEQYVIGGQPTVTGWQVISAVRGIEEDSETKQTAAGQFKAKITYSRRRTMQLTLEATQTADVDEFSEGGVVTVDTVVYKIRSVQEQATRGPTQVTLDLIATVDLLA